MKAKLTGKIKSIHAAGGGAAVIAIECLGKADAKSIDAKEVKLDATLTVKQLIANDIKLGSTFTIFITDEEAPE